MRAFVDTLVPWFSESLSNCIYFLQKNMRPFLCDTTTTFWLWRRKAWWSLSKDTSIYVLCYRITLRSTLLLPINMWRNFRILPTEEEVAATTEPPDKFSKIDIYSRLIFPLVYVTLLISYYSVYTYYLVDDKNRYIVLDDLDWHGTETLLLVVGIPLAFWLKRIHNFISLFLKINNLPLR